MAEWTTFGFEAEEGDTQYEVSDTCYLTFRDLSWSGYKLVGADILV